MNIDEDYLLKRLYSKEFSGSRSQVLRWIVEAGKIVEASAEDMNIKSEKQLDCAEIRERDRRHREWMKHSDKIAVQLFEREHSGKPVTKQELNRLNPVIRMKFRLRRFRHNISMERKQSALTQKLN